MPSRASVWISVCLLFVGTHLPATEGENSPHFKIATYRLSEIYNRVQDHGLAIFFGPTEKREEYKRLLARQEALHTAIWQEPRPPAYEEQLLKDMKEINMIRGKLDLFRQASAWDRYPDGDAIILDYLRRRYLDQYPLILEAETWRTIKGRYSKSIVGDIEVTDITPEVTKTVLEAIGSTNVEAPNKDGSQE
jgi:hypothetical protein